MAQFRIEVMDKNGKSLDVRHMDIPCDTPEEATKHTKVYDLKKEARMSGYAFRITKMDNKKESDRKD